MVAVCVRRVRRCSRLTCLRRVLARDAGVIVKRLMAGRFMTALDMAGVSLSLLPLDETRSGLARTVAVVWVLFTT